MTNTSQGGATEGNAADHAFPATRGQKIGIDRIDLLCYEPGDIWMTVWLTRILDYFWELRPSSDWPCKKPAKGWRAKNT
jgi:hypothetical protein